jgi:hypothetical protein
MQQWHSVQIARGSSHICRALVHATSLSVDEDPPPLRLQIKAQKDFVGPSQLKAHVVITIR